MRLTLSILYTLIMAASMQWKGPGCFLHSGFLLSSALFVDGLHFHTQRREWYANRTSLRLMVCQYILELDHSEIKPASKGHHKQNRYSSKPRYSHTGTMFSSDCKLGGRTFWWLSGTAFNIQLRNRRGISSAEKH